jgi:haloalkane dehalogenase
VFPTLVPITPDDPASEANRAAWDVFAKWDKPMLMLFSDSDPVTAGSDRLFLERVPGTAGQPHRTIEKAGHFLQEDKGPEVATAIADFVAATI